MPEEDGVSGRVTESSSEATDKAMLLKLKVTIGKVRRERERERERESSTDCQ